MSCNNNNTKRSNNRMSSGGKRNKASSAAAAAVDSASTAASTAPSTPPSSSNSKPLLSTIMTNSLMKKFERLSVIIDDSLEKDTILPYSLCSNLQQQQQQHHASDSDYIENTNDVTDDTAANTSDERSHLSTTPDELDHNNGNFASWLASQEFDASAIVWNGDDTNPQDLSAELLNNDDDDDDAATVVSTLGRSCEYSKDEFLGDGVDDGLALAADDSNAHGNGNVIKAGVGEDGDDDEYVSIADVNRNKWGQSLPPAMSHVWNKVISTNWQCWQGGDGQASNSGTSCSAAINNFYGSKKKQKQQQHGKSRNKKRIITGAETRRLNDEIAKTRAAAFVPKTVPKHEYPPSILKKSSSFVSSDHTLASPTLSVVSSGEDGEKKSRPMKIEFEKKKKKKRASSTNENAAAAAASIKSSTRNEDTSSSRQSGSEEDNAKNLEDALSQVVSSHVSSSRAAAAATTMHKSKHPDQVGLLLPITCPCTTDQSVATSVATPLAGVHFLEEYGTTTSYAATSTPHRNNDTSTASNSCTYSASPGGSKSFQMSSNDNMIVAHQLLAHPYYGGSGPPSAGAHANIAPHTAVSTVTTITLNTFSTTKDYIPFAAHAPLSLRQNDSDVDDDSDTPLLMYEFADQVVKGANNSSSEQQKNKWKNGRRRRRMRLTK